ncbi:Uncharacterised protein [Klebsiella variicola]|uniref:hypothetical protein n=1 Tax=Klebsiella TaxID=570 RepID=UPI000C9C9DD8|nr:MULTISPECIES: hypothetical protein [Klebsiella]MBG2644320.1 hypothetical protein [Klebsiella michiganensis]MBX4796554.1 hypothetical protein [Klebsiella michiganensis]SQC46609.1 Uncharacterised protein [Klebsiella pneumoniae]STW44961.1 Uncharacterised protein [Klebsiella variicola]HBY9728520.1 hypothetical protein [Klebsiella pneumoniae]
MAEKEIKIPFSYCRLSRGASFLGVEPSDLINLAVENKIEISMMLKSFYCRILLREDFSDVKEWYSSLYFPRTFNAMSGQTRAITKHSFIEFTNKSYFKPNTLLSGADIFTEQEGKGFLVGYAFALGLWRIMPDQFEVDSKVKRFFPGFYPCLTGGESPVVQILPAQPFIDNANGKRFSFDPHEFDASYEDLWVTNYDIKRIMESGLDFDTLPMLNEIERPDLNSDKPQDINARSEKAHERHARNELSIVRAAFRFKETSIDIFNEDCLKKGGGYNFSAWARHVIDQVSLFPNNECPVRSVDTVASYISKVFKSDK